MFFNLNQFHLFGFMNTMFINPYNIYKTKKNFIFELNSYFNKRVTYNIVIQNLLYKLHIEKWLIFYKIDNENKSFNNMYIYHLQFLRGN